MVMNVSGALAAYRQTMGAASGADKTVGATAGSGVPGASFSDTLKGFVGDAVENMRSAEDLATQGALGKASVQDIVLAVTKAEVDFSTIVSLRDKFINAYQEIMRTSV